MAPAPGCCGAHGVHKYDIAEIIFFISLLKGIGCHDVCLIKRDV